jgi:hypothetical protein
MTNKKAPSAIPEPYKYYRFYVNHDEKRDGSDLSRELRRITGYSIDDYIPLVTSTKGAIVSLFSDESRTKSHYAVSMVLTQHRQVGELRKIEEKLESLIDRYRIEHIHFREIFGRTQKPALSPQRKRAFLQDYIRIVGGIPLVCVAQSHDSRSLRATFGEVSEQSLYFHLFLNILQYVIARFPENAIFHLYREQPLNMMPPPNSKDQQRLVEDHFAGIQEVARRESKYISFCMHPHFFSKRALFVSSLADLAAYGSSVIQNQIMRGVPADKIVRGNVLLLSLIKTVFSNCSGFTSPAVVDLLNRVDIIH